MSFRNDPLLLDSAIRGYQGLPFDGPETSLSRDAWKAGKSLFDTGRTTPQKCATFRGKTIRIETGGGTEFKFIFDRPADTVRDIVRINN
jgi:hypothetical protein